MEQWNARKDSGHQQRTTQRQRSKFPNSTCYFNALVVFTHAVAMYAILYVSSRPSSTSAPHPHSLTHSHSLTGAAAVLSVVAQIDVKRSVQSGQRSCVADHFVVDHADDELRTTRESGSAVDRWMGENVVTPWMAMDMLWCIFWCGGGNVNRWMREQRTSIGVMPMLVHVIGVQNLSWLKGTWLTLLTVLGCCKEEAIDLAFVKSCTHICSPVEESLQRILPFLWQRVDHFAV